MSIRIGTKLIAAFIPVILLMVALALYLTSISQKSLRQSVGESSMFLAEEMLKRISRSIYLKIELLQSHSHNILIQKLLLESNREFKKFDSVEEYITQKDREWISVPKDQITPLTQHLINNELANNLRQEIVEFYRKKYGYTIFEEIFITNRHGANVAQTTKTSDYKQDDEDWWQIAKERKVYVSDVEYDDSSQSHGITIGIRIDDNTGNFMGILKAVLSVKEIIREAEIAIKKYETTNTLLIRKDGLLLYRTSAFKLMEDVSNKDLFKMAQNERGFFTAVDNGTEKLFSYAHAKGYREFGGLGWILMVVYDIEEILQPTYRLRNTMFAASFILIAMGIIIAFLMSRSIIRPIAILSKGVEIIGKGDLEYRIEPQTKDEIGELTTAFNKMTERHKQSKEQILRQSAVLE
ncbi:MAG: HAMP domain-containing protein, partial [Thermodesulfobacteriota bacterium]|nr:HAMP domain-containing protein [Thermodesulfobacteriota bacterium]